jgi:hypothetical protein
MNKKQGSKQLANQATKEPTTKLIFICREIDIAIIQTFGAESTDIVARDNTKYLTCTKNI